MPTSLPSRVTGTHFVHLRSPICHSGVSSLTEMTSAVMTSPRFLPCDSANSWAKVLPAVTTSSHHRPCFSMAISIRLGSAVTGWYRDRQAI